MIVSTRKNLLPSPSVAKLSNVMVPPPPPVTANKVLPLALLTTLAPVKITLAFSPAYTLALLSKVITALSENAEASIAKAEFWPKKILLPSSLVL